MISVLSVEPYGMKQFDLLGQIIWWFISVLSVEPYGMKPHPTSLKGATQQAFQCSRSSRMG